MRAHGRYAELAASGFNQRLCLGLTCRISSARSPGIDERMSFLLRGRRQRAAKSVFPTAGAERLFIPITVEIVELELAVFI